jgi:nicotinate-nucleotide adenylyltransferase
MRDRIVLPPNAPGMRIGLFGGTFDPAHAAHRAACLLALHRLNLDRVWWLVTPGNPLKDTQGLAPLAETVSYLRRRCPGVHFVWIMGADNLRSFHRWQRWRDIAQLVPIAIVDRLGPSLYATGSAAAQALARYRLPEAAARKLPDHEPPAWIYLHGLKSPLSSTALRAARALKRR